MTGALDPRTQAQLEEERDLLLRSLDDLEAERAAGDLDDEDYQALHDDYTVRTAAILRRLNSPDGAGPASAGGDSAEGDGAEQAGEGPSSRRVLTVLGLLAVAVVAGLMLARTAGERGVNDQITGAIDESARNKVVRCQELGSTGGDLIGSLECFDEVLADDPSNPEALAYRGWYLLLTAGSLQQAADGSAESEADAVELMAGGLDYLDRAIEADPTYADPLAFRASVYDRLGESQAACADIATLLTLDPPPFFVEQTAAIAARNAC